MSEQAESVQAVIFKEMATLVEPLYALRSSDGVRGLLSALGWVVPDEAITGLEDAGEILAAVVDAADAVQRAVFGTQTFGADQMLEIGGKVVEVFSAASGIEACFPATTDFFNTSGIKDPGILFARLADYLTATYFLRRRPRVFAVLLLTGLIQRVIPNPLPRYHASSGYYMIPWDDIPSLFSAPGDWLSGVYSWGTDPLGGSETAGFNEQRLFANLLIFMAAFGAPGGIYLATDNVEELRYPLFKDGDWDNVYEEFGLAARPLPAGPGTHRGLAIGPYLAGSIAAAIPLGPRWKLELGGALATGPQGLALELRPGEDPVVTGLAGGAVGASFMLQMTQQPNAPGVTTDLFLVGSETSPIFLRLRGMLASARVDIPQVEWLKALLKIGELKAHVGPQAFDSFLAAVLPPEGLNLISGMGLELSNTQPPHFTGSAGLEVEKDLADLGPITNLSIYLGVHATQNDINAILAASLSLRLGPFTANLERLGLALKIGFPRDVAPDVSLGFQPPRGLALALDAPPVKGGGYLLFDPANAQYAGAFELHVGEELTLKAVGILTTRLPGGTAGFSLLIIISAEFSPVKLGLGFTLNAVGGIFGYNRMMSFEALRQGVKDHTLDTILFPRDPIGRAGQIISSLNKVFPPAAGRYVFGPMVRIGWGEPTIMTLDLAVVLEWPAPVRLAILGRLRVVLPEEKQAIVLLQLDAVGTVDFDRRDAAFDAALHDSRIAGYTVTGTMAMRLHWGPNSVFLLAVGGFNPRFQPPADFPALKRITVSLMAGGNPEVRLAAYLALTSNTVQFGARLDVAASLDLGLLGVFSVQGFLEFDALFQLSPFAFVVAIEGSAALKHNGDSLFAVYLRVLFSGPQPWHVEGEADFAFYFLGRHDIRIGFNVTWGPAAPPPALPVVDPLPELVGALADLRNWRAELPAGGLRVAALRAVQAPAGTVLVHPFGSLSVRQRVLPLETTLTRYGAAKLTKATRYQVESVSLNGGAAAWTAVTDDFARAQFVEQTDDQKLTQPSFEVFTAGVRFASDGVAVGGGFVVVSGQGFDNNLVDPALGYEGVLPAAPAGLAAAAVTAAVQVAALAAAPAAPAPGFAVRPAAYVLSKKALLDPIGTPAQQQGQSFTQMLEALLQVAAQDPAAAARLHIVPTHEVNTP